MGDIVKRLEKSILFDAHNGDETERNVCKRQAVQAIAEINRLRAIVDKLPKTADGVPVVPGMEVWVLADPVASGVVVEVMEFGYTIRRDIGEQYITTYPGHIFGNYGYSTEAAALAAKEVGS